MKRHHFLITINTLLFFCFFNLSSMDAQIDHHSKKFITTIDSIFADKSDMANPGASVIIMKGKELLLSKNYGSANLSFDIPFNEKTLFPLPNFTEQLVAFSILQLEKKEQISLSDPVNKYVPELGFKNQVSLSHLLNHSSGLPVIGSLRLMAGWNFTDPFYPDDFLNLTKSITKDLNSGMEYNHSHAGIRVLMIVVEKVSGLEFSEYVSTNIFTPLGMTNSFIRNKNFKDSKNLSIGYDSAEDGFKKTRYVEYAGFCPLTYSTQNDFEKWMLNIQTKKFRGDILRKMNQALTINGKLQKRENRNYCVGQNQYYKFLGEDEYYSMDSHFGHSWKWIRLKQSDLSIMAITNSNASMSSKVNAIARLLVSQKTESTTSKAEEPKPEPIELSEKELQAYTGFYWDDRYLFTTQISIKDGKLFYEDLHNGWNFSLTPLSKNLFESPPWNQVEFTNLDGQKKLKLMLMDGREFPSDGYDPEIIKVKDYNRFTGFYTSDKLNAFFRLVKEDNKLILKRSRKPDLELLPIGYNKFRADEIDFRLIEFEEDANKSIYQMKISNTGLKNVEFRKLK